MEVNSKTRIFLDVLGALLHESVTDEIAAKMLVDNGYSSDIESARRTVLLIHNDISNSRMSKNNAEDSLIQDAFDRDYKKEYQNYHAKPEQKKNRAARNKARKIMGLKVGDPREVDHKKPLSTGGSNHKRNLRIVSRLTNRRKGNDEKK